MLGERWAPSRGLRALAGVQGITQVARVEESGRLGAEITTASGWSFGIGPHPKRRATGAATVLIGAVLLCRAWHDRRVAGQPG